MTLTSPWKTRPPPAACDRSRGGLGAPHPPKQARGRRAVRREIALPRRRWRRPRSAHGFRSEDQDSRRFERARCCARPEPRPAVGRHGRAVSVPPFVPRTCRVSARPPEGGCGQLGTVPGAAPCRAGWSLVGLLSWGSSQRCPSIDIQRARPVPTRCRPRPTGCPADRTCGPWSLRSWVRRDFAASLRPRLATPGLLPPLPFLTTTTACSAHAVQVCCTLQPIMGFAWLQARSLPLVGHRKRCRRRRRCRSPSLE